jgi:phosphoribosylformimino-5-aminoimidazole carboxamide ribotide isomerase
MLIIPSIEFENGICSQCISGEPGTEDLYSNLQKSPEDLIKLLRKENFKALHLIDRDSLLNSKPINFEFIKKITDAIDIPVELHAGFSSIDDCKRAIDSGLYRLIISNKLLERIKICKEMVKEFSASRICFAVIVKEGKLYDKDLADSITADKLLTNIIETGAKRVLFGTYESVFGNTYLNVEDYEMYFANKNLKYTLYGGILTPKQLWDLSRGNNLNIDSVIIGNALFNNSFPCQKIWRIIEAELENVKKT